MSALHSQGLEQEGKVVTRHCCGMPTKLAAPGLTEDPKKHSKGDEAGDSSTRRGWLDRGQLVPSTKMSSGLSQLQSAGCRPRLAVNQAAVYSWVGVGWELCTEGWWL